MLSTVLLLSLSGQSYSWSCGASTAAAPRAAIVATRPIRRSAAPRAAASVRPVNVAIVGGGTVGGGIVEILSEKAPFLRDALGIEAKISKICVRDAGRQRDFTLPDGCVIVTDVSEVLDDEAVELVVEVMGGTDLAKTVVTSALRSGKHVVTANKALIAAHLPELNALVASVNAGRADKVRFGYEAAVCGGIPVIHALQRDLLGDSVPPAYLA